MDETFVDGAKAFALIIAGLSTISLAIVMFWVAFGGGLYVVQWVHFGPHVYLEVIMLGVVGLSVIVWAGFYWVKIISKWLALRKAQNKV